MVSIDGDGDGGGGVLLFFYQSAVLWLQAHEAISNLLEGTSAFGNAR